MARKNSNARGKHASGFKVARFATIWCHCGRPIKIMKPGFITEHYGMVSHATCRNCNLSWHLDLNGEFYSHIWKQNDKDVHDRKTQST